MKKTLRIFAFGCFSFSAVAQLTACDVNPINDGGGGNKPPTPPIPKNLTYYQKLLTVTNKTLQQFADGIAEFIANKNGIANFDQLLAELQAEENSYSAIKYDCLYHILYLTYNGNFTPEQKKMAKQNLTDELTNLTKQLETKEKYKKDYPSSELQEIQVTIKDVQKELTKY